MPSHGTMVAIDDERFAVTALKRRISDNGLVLRGFNLSNQSIDLKFNGALQLNLLEEALDTPFEGHVGPCNIQTLLIKEEE
ncbi:Uncharacterised protein [Streptococcus pasteurianus]|nr:Uncharacterised protein [Streptococcus pasteurianus]